MNIREYVLHGLLLTLSAAGWTQNASYDGLNYGFANLYRLSNAKTYSISPENTTGEKGRGAWRPPAREPAPLWTSIPRQKYMTRG